MKKHNGGSSVEETAQAFGGLLRQGIAAFATGRKFGSDDPGSHADVAAE